MYLNKIFNYVIIISYHCCCSICNRDLLSDIQVHVQGKTYNCHKVILSNVSRFFYDQLVIKDCKETAITLDGVESSTFDIIHEFIYTDNDNEALLMNVSLPLMIKLLDCADKLKMPRLIKSCIRVTQNRLKSITKPELIELFMKLYSLPFVQEVNVKVFKAFIVHKFNTPFYIP